MHHQAKARLVNCYAMWAELSASLDEPLCRRLLATEARQTIGSSYVPPCGEPLAAMLAIRDAGLPQPGCGWCISPWVDTEAAGETMVSKSTVDPTVQKAGILDKARLYFSAADPRSPLAAPIYADLTGLAPLLIQVGAAEPCSTTRSASRGWRAPRTCASISKSGRNDPRMAPVPSRAEGGPAGD